MESPELRIFKEVACAESISKAAENMGYVQSNITAHIKKLETELNTSLFIRHNKGITLTPDGEKLLYQAEKILGLLDQTSRFFKGTPKTFKIGATQTIAGYLLPQCLIEYQKQFPNVSVSVCTFQQNDLNEQFSAGQLDCMITNRPGNISQGKQIFECKEKLMLISPSSCQTLEDTKDFPVIANRIKSCPYREVLLNWWHLHHSEMPQILELDTVEAILHTVAMNGGISLLPEHVLQERQNINCFYMKELQSTSIHMWVSKDKPPSEYLVLKDILKKQFII